MSKGAQGNKGAQSEAKVAVPVYKDQKRLETKG